VLRINRWGLLDAPCAGILFRMGQKSVGTVGFQYGPYAKVVERRFMLGITARNAVLKCGELLR